MAKRPDDGKLEIAIDWLENYESLDPECEAYVACQTVAAWLTGLLAESHKRRVETEALKRLAAERGQTVSELRRALQTIRAARAAIAAKKVSG